MPRSYPHLGRPLRIGDVVLKNRMAVAAMGANLAEADGSCSERLIAYHARQAKGGAGLIVLGATGVALPAGKVHPWQVGISEDRHIPGLRSLAAACHRYGAKVAVQLHHGGLLAAQDFAAESIGNDEAGTPGQQLLRKSGSDGKIEAVAPRQIVLPLSIDAKVLDGRFDFDDGNRPVIRQHHNVGAPAIRQRYFEQGRAGSCAPQAAYTARDRQRYVGTSRRSGNIGADSDRFQRRFTQRTGLAHSSRAFTMGCAL